MGVDAVDLEKLLGDQQIELECPGCNRAFKVKFKDISRDGAKMRCPGCGRDIAISHSAESQRTLRNVNKALRDLERSLKRLGR